MRFIYQALVKLYPKDFRREYGDLIVDCIELKIAAQTSKRSKVMTGFIELISLCGSSAKQRFFAGKSSLLQAVLPIVGAAAITMAGNRIIRGLMLNYRPSTQLLIMIPIIASTIWLCFTYSAVKIISQRLMFSIVAAALASYGFIERQFDLYQLIHHVNANVPGLQLHPIPYAWGVTYYIIAFINYALAFVAVFFVAHIVMKLDSRQQMQQYLE